MSVAEPTLGRVVHHAYLWHREQRRGQSAGRKERPCVVILLDSDSVPGATIASVLPITHSEPRDGDAAIELKAGTKRRLGLDRERSWIVTDEFNRFTWPGFDLRPTPDGRPDYGLLPADLTRQLRQQLIANHHRQRLKAVERDS